MSSEVSKKVKYSLVGIVFLCLSIFFPAITNAHTSGASIEKVVGNYLLDVGFTPEFLFEDTQIRFDFSVYDNTTKQEISFSEVWVRIEKEGKLLFAGGLNKARFGATGLAYNFSEGGNYKVSARFSGATSTIAEAEFDLPVTEIVEPLTKREWFKSALYTSCFWLVSIITIIAVVQLFRKKRIYFPKINKKVLNIVINSLIFLLLVVVGYLVASKAYLLAGLF